MRNPCPLTLFGPAAIRAQNCAAVVFTLLAVLFATVPACAQIDVESNAASRADAATSSHADAQEARQPVAVRAVERGADEPDVLKLRAKPLRIDVDLVLVP